VRASHPLLAVLPERERHILLLRFFGGLTQTEIAAQVGLSQMHVSRLLARTLAQLRRQLTPELTAPGTRLAGSEGGNA
jgi:RNA polymerase sigma-B factor